MSYSTSKTMIGRILMYRAKRSKREDEEEEDDDKEAKETDAKITYA